MKDDYYNDDCEYQREDTFHLGAASVEGHLSVFGTNSPTAASPGTRFTLAPMAAPAGAPRHLPDDASREDYPLFDGLFAYFPAALAEVARWSVVGNRKHNPGQPLHWSRGKSTDHENKILRHLLDARAVDKDGFPEAVAMAWRALALCQTILEERGRLEGANSKRDAKDAK